INIKLKKNKTFGTNGTVNAGYGIGTYGKYNGGFSLNHRNSKINAFGNYNYNQSLNVSNFVSYRVQGDTIFDQRNTMKNRNKGSHNFKGGLDYFLSKNATIGVILTGNISDNLSEARGPMQIIYAPTNTLSRVLVASNTNSGERKNANLNLNYRYAITGRKELNLDADYGKFRIRGNQFQPNEYFNATMSTKLFDNTYRMISPTDIGIYSFKADYEQPFKKGKLGMGGKFAYVSTDNNFQRYNVFGTNEVYDRDRSNLFKYKENINALYANFNRAYKGFTVQVGLRVENTISKGRSLGEVFDTTLQNYKAYDSSINRNYTGLFPSAAITFNKNPMKQWGLTFSRRIDRPAYQDLNPFEFKINDYTFMKGNTRLMPQYTNSFGLTYSYKYKLNFALNYSHVKDIFTQLPDTTERSKAFMTKKNLNSQDIVSLNVSYPFQYKWYS
ncbi:MAG: TonB-dependent receptor, partial [Pedobacter sp.]